MATRNVNVTTAPANLVSTHSLVIGTRYALQNVDANARIFLREAAVRPAVSLRAFIIPRSPRGLFPRKPAPEFGFGPTDRTAAPR